jgi:hypothetical protein
MDVLICNNIFATKKFEGLSYCRAKNKINCRAKNKMNCMAKFLKEN